MTGNFNIDKNGVLTEYRGEKKQFSIISNGDVVSEVTAFYKDKIQTVIIPGNVKEIGFFAFKDCSARTIICQEGVQRIPLGAFWHCNSLCDVFLPQSIKQISPDAFPVRDTREAKVTIHANYVSGLWGHLKKANWLIRKVPKEIYENYSGTLLAMKLAYKRCANLVLHVKGDLHDYEFDSYPVDCQVVIEENICARYIFQCSAISRVHIAKDVNYIHQDTLSAAGEYFEDTSLEAITVAAESQYFYDIDGVLFEKETNRLIRYPQLMFLDQNTYYVPESTKSIGSGAFCWCYGIEFLYIPKHTSLEQDALCYIPKLDKVFREIGG